MIKEDEYLKFGELSSWADSDTLPKWSESIGRRHRLQEDNETRD